MDIKELRIGNWVCRAEKFIEQVDLSLFVNHDAASCMAYYSSIPVTNEWIEKLGIQLDYDNDGEKVFDFSNVIPHTVIERVDDNWCITGGDYAQPIKLKGVHHLQNIMHSMAGL